jgi:hypothetical protein
LKFQPFQSPFTVANGWPSALSTSNPRPQEGEPALEHEQRRLALARGHLDARRQHLLVHEHPHELHPPRDLLLGDADRLAVLRIEQIKGVGQLEHADVFADEDEMPIEEVHAGSQPELSRRVQPRSG